MGSLYLCPPPSALSGVARLLDFGNTFDSYNRAENGAEADGLRILWDWAVVGDSLWQALAANESITEMPEGVKRTEAEMASR